MAEQFDRDSADKLVGMRMLTRLQPLLDRLHDEATERDRAGNRDLYYDHVCSLILLSFFNPSLTTLRNLQAASRLRQVRKKLGCSQTSLGSLSESMRLFKPQRLVEIIEELLGQLPEPATRSARLAQLTHIPTAVDGTLLLRLPQVTQACFASRKDRGWRLHTQFEVLRGVPVKARVTAGDNKGEANEKAVLRGSLERDRCYIVDRGYEEFSLFNAIVAAGSSYVCRVRADHHFHSETNAELPPEAQAAGVLEDAQGRMGSAKSKRIEHPDHHQRRIVIKFTEHPKRGGRRRRSATQNIVLVTNLTDVPADMIVLLYRFRWLIELFFRWLKCVLSCRHLMSRSSNGIEIQMYCALIACLLIQLATGRDTKPTQWTYKLLCLYTSGWADEDEVIAHLKERAAATAKDV